jgi:hypothetical protein
VARGDAPARSRGSTSLVAARTSRAAPSYSWRGCEVAPGFVGRRIAGAATRCCRRLVDEHPHRPGAGRRRPGGQGPCERDVQLGRRRRGVSERPGRRAVLRLPAPRVRLLDRQAGDAGGSRRLVDARGRRGLPRRTRRHRQRRRQPRARERSLPRARASVWPLFGDVLQRRLRSAACRRDPDAAEPAHDLTAADSQPHVALGPCRVAPRRNGAGSGARAHAPREAERQPDQPVYGGSRRSTEFQ